MSGNEKKYAKKRSVFCDVFFAIKTKNKLIRLKKTKNYKSSKIYKSIFYLFSDHKLQFRIIFIAS